MKANNPNIDFNKTKQSLSNKFRNTMSEINNNNLRETLSVFSFNNTNNEKKTGGINVKLGDKDEYEFPNIRTMQKELIQKIYSKESGEIINVIKKTNENLKNLKLLPKNETASKYNSINGTSNGMFNSENNPNLSKSNNLHNISNNTSSTFYIKNKNHLFEDSKGEIVSIKKKNRKDIYNQKSRVLSNNFNIKDQSYINNTSNYNNENNNNSRLNVSNKHNMSHSQNNNYGNFSTKNGNLHIQAQPLISKSNQLGDEKNLYVTQSVKSGYPNVFDPFDKKLNLTSKISQNSWNSINKIFSKKNSGFFCPHCEHCNNIKDENLDTYFAMKEAKNIVKKGFDYICEYYENDQSFLDFLINLNQNKENTSNNVNANILNGKSFVNSSNNPQNLNQNKSTVLNEKNSHYPKHQSNQNYNMNIINGELDNIRNNKKSTKFDLENLLITFPKFTNDRNILQLVTHFLEALSSDKIAIEQIVSPEIYEKLKVSLISQGLAFKMNDNEVEFDKEIDSLFDEFTREKIRKLFKTKFKEMKEIQKERKQIHEEELIDIRKRFMMLFLIFIQLIAEMGAECKEKAILLYKVFKMFFAEQERKWANLTFKIKEKIGYYKDLCRTLIENKNNNTSKIDKINDILFAKRLTTENLEDHKTLIYNLLNLLNEKRDYTYLLKSEVEIMNRELNFFVYGFEKIKLDTKLREKFREIDVGLLAQNINDEMSHKQVSELEKVLLVNSDIFSIVSGHRNYFYEQKAYYLNEISRITDLFEKANFKKSKYKKEMLEISKNFEREKERLEKDIQYFREKVIGFIIYQLSCEKIEVLVQTDVDSIMYNRIIKNHNLINYQRSLDQNKLYHFIEKIKFNCSKQKPFTKKSILNLIPEIYNEKIEFDSTSDIEGFNRMTMDEFFYKFMREKFKLTKIVKKNCEQTILTVIKYSIEDSRIDFFRRFLGVGDSKIQREVLDCFLNVLKNLPISFYKIFEEADSPYIMSLDYCFEIYNHKFSYYFLCVETIDKLIRSCEIFEGDNKLEGLGYEKIRDKYLLFSFYSKNIDLFEKLLNEYKSKIKNEENLIILANHFMLCNKDFDLNLQIVCDIFKNNFQIKNDQIDLDSFFTFFMNKYYFKIKILDFISISIDRLINIYNGLDKLLLKMWENADMKRNGIIFFKEFEQVMSVLLGNSENKWKIAEYFNIACGSKDKDFVNKNEFYSFCLNNKEILVILLSERKYNMKALSL